MFFKCIKQALDASLLNFENFINLTSKIAYKGRPKLNSQIIKITNSMLWILMNLVIHDVYVEHKACKNIIYCRACVDRYTNMILGGYDWTLPDEYIDMIWWLWPKPITLIAKENCLICVMPIKLTKFTSTHMKIYPFSIVLSIKDNKFLFLICNKISWFVIDQRKSNQMICHNSTHLHTLWQSKKHKSVELPLLVLLSCDYLITENCLLDNCRDLTKYLHYTRMRWNNKKIKN